MRSSNIYMYNFLLFLLAVDSKTYEKIIFVVYCSTVYFHVDFVSFRTSLFVFVMFFYRRLALFFTFADGYSVVIVTDFHFHPAHNKIYYNIEMFVPNSDWRPVGFSFVTVLLRFDFEPHSNLLFEPPTELYILTFRIVYSSTFFMHERRHVNC